MDWLFFALATALLWSFGQIFLKKGFASFSPLITNVLDVFVYIAMFVPFALLRGASLEISFTSFGILIVAAILYVLYYYALEKGLLSISGTIISGYPIVTVILSGIFLHEVLSPFQSAMIGLTLLGGLIIGYFSVENNRKKKTSIVNAFLWPLLGAIAIGSADFIAKVAIDDVGVDNYIFYIPLAYVLAVAFYWLIDKKGRALPKKIKKGPLLYTILGAIFINAGLLTLDLGFSTGLASLVAPISSSYVALTLLLAYIFLKERLKPMQWVGVAIVTVGIIGIGF